MEEIMRLKINALSFVSFGICLFIIGIFLKPGYADGLTPTPTWVWKSNPKKPADPSYTPSASYKNLDEDYDPEDDNRAAEKNGVVTGTPLTKATMKPEPDAPTNFKIEPDDGSAHLTWDP